MRYHSLIVLLALSFLWPSAGSARAGDPKTDIAEFEGKYVLLVLKNKAMYGLEKVQLRTLGTQTFLRGNQLYNDTKEAESKYPVMFPVNDVRSIHGFASIEELKKNKLILFPDPPTPTNRVEIDKLDVQSGSGDRYALAAAAGMVMFLGGMVAGWWWHREPATAPTKQAPS